MSERKNMQFLILFILLLFFTCTDPDRMEPTDAWVTIYTAIEFKKSECQSSPHLPFVVPNPLDHDFKPDKNKVNACAFSIINQECPFSEYSVVCLELFEIDISGIGGDD